VADDNAKQSHDGEAVTKIFNSHAEVRRRLRAARAYAGLSRTELAERLGISKDTIERIENGRRQFGEFELPGLLEKFADATGLPAGFFTEDWRALEEQRLMRERPLEPQLDSMIGDFVREMRLRLDETLAEKLPGYSPDPTRAAEGTLEGIDIVRERIAREATGDTASEEAEAPEQR
jgi:transcriptional regulator with XRE-family HTH domain